jgi:hypothetical protein
MLHHQRAQAADFVSRFGGAAIAADDDDQATAPLTYRHRLFGWRVGDTGLVCMATGRKSRMTA